MRQTLTRPIWTGTITFGLVNIPVSLYSAENQRQVHFHLLDSRDKSRVHYVRMNEKGREVPWDKVVKAYEFEKGNYVVVDEKELEKTVVENFQIVEIISFVDKEEIDSIYYDKPYYLAAEKKGEKGYLLLYKTLEHTKKVGIVKVVIRTKEYLAALLPYKNILLLNILRFHEDLRNQEGFGIKPEWKSLKISPQENQMAERLIENMTTAWKPQAYHNENQALLSDLVHKKIKKRSSLVQEDLDSEVKTVEKGGAKVIDFMALLKKSLEEKGKKQNTRTHKESHRALKIQRKPVKKNTTKMSKISKISKMAKASKTNKTTKSPKNTKTNNTRKIKKHK